MYPLRSLKYIFVLIIIFSALLTSCLQTSSIDGRVCGEWVAVQIYRSDTLDPRQVKHVRLHLAQNGAYDFSSFQGEKEQGSYHFSEHNDKLFLRPSGNLVSYYLDVKKLENDSLTLKMKHSGSDIVAVFAKKSIDAK